jgi:taurine dioxygenase
MTSKISHRPYAPFGVEAELDLSRGVTPEDQEELRRLYAKDGFLVLRGLKLSMAEQLDFCEAFGPVLRGEQDKFYVSNVRDDGLFGDIELIFHHDVAYVPAPFLSGCLHAVEVTDGVSATRYANGFRAYERMPQKLRDRLEGRNAIFMRPRRDDQRCRLIDAQPGDNCAVHALVGRQAGTGRPYFFANQQQTALVIGMSEAESEDLLQEAFSYLYAKDNIYDHAWKTGDLVVWDNLAYNHARGPIVDGVRTLQRVTVAYLSYDEQYPADQPWLRELQPGGSGIDPRRSAA